MKSAKKSNGSISHLERTIGTILIAVIVVSLAIAAYALVMKKNKANIVKTTTTTVQELTPEQKANAQKFAEQIQKTTQSN